MDQTPERLARIEWALPFVTGSAAELRPLDSSRAADTPAGSATEPWQFGLFAAACAVHDGQLSPTDLVKSCLDRIAATDPAVQAFATVTAESAVERAAELSRLRPVGVLHGIPFAAKDLIDTAGVSTESGSAIYAGRVPDRDAEVVQAVRSAGGVLAGKTHTHEIAYGVSTPQSRNPWDTTKMTSGSSGGSAAALAARQVPAALGSDTGGSLRLPSAFCGTTAIKPTYGLVSRVGVEALSPSYDVVGPMARSARDALLLLRVLTGQVDGDPREVLGELPGVQGVRVGVPDAEFLAAARPEVLAAVERVAQVLSELGAELVPVTLPPTSVTGSVSTIIVFKEAARRYGEHVLTEAPFAEDIQSFVEAGVVTTNEDYLLAQRMRRAVTASYGELLRQVDVILLPTSPITDLPHGAEQVDGVPLIPVLTPFTFPASSTGLPAVAFPCGFTAGGMPIGAQLLGSAFAETRLAGIAAAYQDVTDWHTRQPVLN